MSSSTPNRRKRKRSASTLPPSSSSVPPAHRGDTPINPRSHTPNTLKQFATAGLSIDAPLPSQVYTGFPHQPIPGPPPPPPQSTSQASHQQPSAHTGSASRRLCQRPGSSHSIHNSDRFRQYYYQSSEYESADGGGGETEEWDDDDDDNDESPEDGGGLTTDDNYDDGEEQDTIYSRSRSRSRSQSASCGSKGKSRRRTGTSSSNARRSPATAHKKHVGGLLQVIDRSLMEGEVTTAKRAFGLLVRSKIYGDKVDLRYGEYWKLGVDILVREGEEEETKRRRRRKRKERRVKKEKERKEELERRKEEEEGQGGSDDEDDDRIIDNQEDDVDDDVEGDEAGPDDDEEDEYKRTRRRAWDILGKVKAYYQTLIQLHPFNRTNPNSPSALDFYPEMYKYEMDDVRKEHEQSLERLERLRRLGGSGFDDDEDDDNENHDQSIDAMDVDHRYHHYNNGDHDGDHNNHQEDHFTTSAAKRIKRLIDRPKDRLRQHALVRMKEIASRVDNTLENLPFSSDYALLSLRARMCVYMGDLSAPVLASPDPSSSSSSGPSQQPVVLSSSPSAAVPGQFGYDNEGHTIREEERRLVEEGNMARQKERKRAKKILTRLKKQVRRGGMLEKADEAFLYTLRKEFIDDEDEDEDDEDEDSDDEGVHGLKMYSSITTHLPIRAV